jgi:very-short-patch-repair endonuclease
MVRLDPPEGATTPPEWATLIVGTTERCDSPIEAALLEALWAVGAELCDNGWFVVRPHFEVETKDSVYRVDFLVGAIMREHLLQAVVECDGHDFHEKTKEQARHDKARDRALQRRGFNVIRFTGSEIHQDADRCAREVFQTMSAGLRVNEVAMGA